MVILMNMLMVVVAAFLIGYPFLVKSRQGYYLYEEDLEVEKKELLFSALGEIEFDYRMKKLSDDDYQLLKQGYQKQALTVLDQEDKLVEEEVEELLAKGRKGKRKKKSSEDDYE
ncbi:MAG: hypothetical protein ACYDG6_10730 [Thermincolia bacterium]